MERTVLLSAHLGAAASIADGHGGDGDEVRGDRGVNANTQ